MTVCMSPKRSTWIQTHFTLFWGGGPWSPPSPKLPFQQNRRVVAEWREDLGSHPASDVYWRWTEHSVSPSLPQPFHLCPWQIRPVGFPALSTSVETPHLHCYWSPPPPRLLCLRCCPEVLCQGQEFGFSAELGTKNTFVRRSSVQMEGFQIMMLK